MAKFNVLMLAFYTETDVIREVEIPDDVLAGMIPECLLNTIFEFGQNDFHPKKCSSVSGGDVIQLNYPSPAVFSLGNDTLLCSGATYS